MSEGQAMLLIFAAVGYISPALFTFIWGHITYTVTLQYPMLKGYEWEKRTGARAMLMAPIWPVFLLVTYGRAWGRGSGRFIGRVWKDAIR